MIQCEWRERGRLLVEADGQVYPCCYLSNSNFKALSMNRPDRVTHKVMQNYNQLKEELNVLNHDLDTIMDHPWWQELEESWTQPNPIIQCLRWCTIKEDEDE